MLKSLYIEAHVRQVNSSTILDIECCYSCHYLPVVQAKPFATTQARAVFVQMYRPCISARKGVAVGVHRDTLLR